MLIETPEDTLSFDEAWPTFLRQAEKMPGLAREATIRITNVLFGSDHIYMIHELFFENQTDLHAAMASPQGQASGQILQKITGGRMTLLIAEHKEDHIENILKYHPNGPEANPN